MATQNENRDKVTGLWNRQYAFDQLKNFVEHRSQVALILIDVDYLELYQERYGLREGNHRLLEIGSEIQSLSGDNALVFELNGDEFGVVLPETSLESARQIAETIRINRKPVLLVTEPKIAALTLSLGISHFPTNAGNAKHLFWGAELALLKAKRFGPLPFDPTPFAPISPTRNRVMAIGDFLDDFPEESARFLKS